MCTHSKREVYHKEGNCLELEANKVKSYTGGKSNLEQDDPGCDSTNEYFQNELTSNLKLEIDPVD